MQSEIKQLEILLKDKFAEKKLVSHKITRLIAAGENYGSTMSAVKVVLETASNELETLQIVAKQLPPGEFMRTMFNINVTFKNEVVFYTKIVPILKEFVKNEGIDEDLLNCFPNVLGARYNLHEKGDEVDDDAVLLMENLKLTGFEVVDRMIGFDYETSVLILKNLAKFHAIPIAMKLKHPEEFQSQIKKFMKEYRIFPLTEEVYNGVIEQNVNLIANDEITKKYLSKVQPVIENSKNSGFNGPKNLPINASEPFGTIIHADLWVNNFMVKFYDNKAAEIKIVDFQLYEYGSPARDLLFFILSSVQIEIIDKSFNALIEIYYESFVNNLKLFNCYNESFNRDKFQVEICKSFTDFILMQSLIMMEPIYATDDKVKELDQYSEADMLKSANQNYPDGFIKRIRIIIQTFAELV